MDASIPQVLERAVSGRDITPEEAHKIQRYTMKKNGDLNMVLDLLHRKHKVSKERLQQLQAGPQSQPPADVQATLPGDTPEDLGFRSTAGSPASSPPSAPPGPPPAGARASGRHRRATGAHARPPGVTSPGSRPPAPGSRPPGPSSRPPGPGSRPPGPGSRPPGPGSQPPRGRQTQAMLAQHSGARHAKDIPPPVSEIGGVKLLNFLGKGAMGAVFKGLHLGFDQEVAVKLLPPERTRQKRFVDLFFKEARSLVKVGHENVVRVYNVGEERNQYFIAMELVVGSDLGEHIKAQKTIEPNEVARIIRDAAKGLHAAHREGLVHRDVKPDNLMITQDGVVKVADFGLAVEAEPEQQGGLKKKSIVGTPYYMPPEQADGSAADARADIYALGCTMFHALVGRVPFKGKSLMDILVQHMTKTPDSPTELNPSVPQPLSNICLKMMAKEAEDRFPDMEALAAALDTFLVGGSVQFEKDAIKQAGQLRGAVSLEDRAPPKLPEPPPVRGFALSSTTAAIIAVTLFFALNYNAIQALAKTTPELPSRQQRALNQLEEQLRPLVDDPKLFDDKVAEFIKIYPKLRTQSLMVAEKFAEKMPGRASHKQANAAFKELKSKVEAYSKAGQLLAACVALESFKAQFRELLDKPEAYKSLLAQYRQRLKAERKLLFIPGGEVKLGGDMQQFTAFFIDQCEVSNEDYAAFLEAESKGIKPKHWRARTCPKGQENWPVTNISYDSAKAYAKWAGKRLPRDLEWEWAARGPKLQSYPWGSAGSYDFKRCNCRQSGHGQVKPVDSYADGDFPGASPFGALNMAGNVAEWVRGALAADSKLAYVRGGGFNSHLEAVRATVRFKLPKSSRRKDLGFRCVTDIPKASAKDSEKDQ